jgi:hypothetical protein
VKWLVGTAGLMAPACPSFLDLAVSRLLFRRRITWHTLLLLPYQTFLEKMHVPKGMVSLVRVRDGLKVVNFKSGGMQLVIYNLIFLKASSNLNFRTKINPASGFGTG